MEEIEETNNTKATDGNQEVPVIGGDLQGFSTPASRGIGVSRAQSFRKEKLVLAGIDDNIPAGFARGCKTEPGNKFPASPSVCGISARNPSSAMEVEKQKPGRVDGSTKAGRPKHAVDSAQGRGMGCLQAFGLPGAHYLDPDADQQDGGRAIDPCFVRGACGQQKGCTKRKCDQPTDEDLSMRSLRSRHEAVGDLAWPESHGRRHDEAKTPLPRTGA